MKNQIMKRFLSEVSNLIKSTQNNPQNALVRSSVYEIPQSYVDIFHLANATVHDNINWFYHNALEHVFDKLVKTVQNVYRQSNLNEARSIVLNSIKTFEHCNQVLEVKIPLKRNSGIVEIINGYSVHHGINKLFLGGIRILPDLEKSHVQAFATLATLKHACVDLPYSGGYSGLQIDPSNYSDSEIDQLLRSFCNEITERCFYGPKINVFEPNVNCTADYMTLFCDQYSKCRGQGTQYGLACATGKPYFKDGLSDYNASIAEGIIIGIDNLINNEKYAAIFKIEKGWKDKTFIIKGFGKIGSRLAVLFYRLGMKCVGICDKDYNFYTENGLDVLDIINFKAQNGSLSTYNIKFSNTGVLEKPADFFIIADSYKTLDCYLAPKIQAKVVIEIASGAITPSAHKTLVGRNILVIPDIFTNASVSMASHVEHSRNIYNVENVGAKYARSYLINRITAATARYPYFAKAVSSFKGENQSEINKYNVTPVFCNRYQSTTHKIMDIVEEYNLGYDIRTAAYILAIEKIFNEYWRNTFHIE